MKIIIFSTMILLASIQLFGQSDFLPKTWEKHFVISLSHSGSMSGGSSRITFTYDSCTIVINSMQGADVNRKFALTQEDRDQILSKMRELKAHKIKAGMSLGAENDGWSNLLCFGSHCIEGGSAARMTDSDKEKFWAASRYLEEFATTHKQ